MGVKARLSCKRTLAFSAGFVFILLVFLILTLAAGGQPASAATASYSAYTITSTGGDCAVPANGWGVWNSSTGTCTLTSDVTFTTYSDGIDVKSSGVTLNGNGHTLMGDSASSTTPQYTHGVYLADVTGVTIKNLTTKGFWEGIGLNSSDDNTISDNVCENSINGGIGIDLSASSSNTVSGNTASNNTYGIDLGSSSNGNTISGNTANDNFWGDGILLTGANNNIVFGNTFSTNSYAIYMGGSDYNQFYHNNILGSLWAQAYINGGSGNLFNLPAPTGGNYWDDFHTAAQGCADANNDGFCDSPYIFDFGGQDNLPLTAPAGTGKPALSLDLPVSFWASLSDFQAGRLSVTWTVSNNGNTSAFLVKLTAGSDTNGVSRQTTLPATLGSGDIAAGSSASVTLKYSVPAGVSSWTAALTASAQDVMGATYTYP